MDEMMVLAVGHEAMRTALFVAMPMLAAGMLVGVIVSILQVATSIQDVTITFIPKILAVFLVFVVAMSWMLRVLLTFTREIFDLASTLVG
jgi:flagellar biosynthetic protein FliQ